MGGQGVCAGRCGEECELLRTRCDSLREVGCEGSQQVAGAGIEFRVCAKRGEGLFAGARGSEGRVCVLAGVGKSVD